MSTIIVFPGQGSQRVGMAEDFFEAHTEARDVFEEASDALNLDVAKLCFEDNNQLHLTEFTQPAIVTAEIAMFRTLAPVLKATHFGGHSLGEYTALVAAGVIPLDQAVRIVRERGRRMQEAVPAGIGAMAAIIQPELPIDLIRQCLDGLEADIANHNAMNQVVVSGLDSHVQTALERYQDTPEGAHAKVRMLTVSAPFHSRLMQPIEPGFRSLLFDSAVAWASERSCAVASNTTGEMHDGTASGLIDRLTCQISQTVRWVDNMTTLCALRPERIIEIGPGRPLRGFFRGMGDSLGDTALSAITNLSSARRALQEAEPSRPQAQLHQAAPRA